jgi:hypothetical protein
MELGAASAGLARAPGASVRIIKRLKKTAPRADREAVIESSLRKTVW